MRSGVRVFSERAGSDFVSYAVRMAMTTRSRPVELAGAPWPTVPSADPIGETARLFVVNLVAAIGADSIRSVAAKCGVNHVTLQNVVAGKVWPDLATIARLEHGIGQGLWPKLGQ
jgi:hypothetical protein